jgi:hypothetical protein
MDFLEKDLEQIIWEANDSELNNKGMCFKGKRYRQLRIGNYGVADIVTVFKKTNMGIDFLTGNNTVIDNYLIITIYELKKDKVGISAFLQALGYIKGIDRYLKKRGFSEYIFRITLVGRTIDNSGSFCYLPDLIGFTIPDYSSLESKGLIQSIDFYTYSYKINGLKFSKQYGLNLIEEGFK